MKKPAFLLLSFATFVCSSIGFGGFSFEQSETQLLLSEDGTPVLAFNFAQIKPPEGEGGHARSGYVHPLYGPQGEILTDDFPVDHPHHRGVFFGWPQMTVLGQKVDGWHMRGLHPTTEQLGPWNTDQGNAFFEAVNFWRMEQQGHAPAIREHLRYKIHPAEETGRFIDLHATFTNLTEEPILLAGSPESAYGGLNIRIDGTRPDVRIATARGDVAENTNAVDPPSPWADHSSRTTEEGPHAGVAIFQHPANPDYPARNWTLRPYGFLGAAWPGESDYTIEPRQSLDLRYRLFIHPGTGKEAEVARGFKQYERTSQTKK